MGNVIRLHLMPGYDRALLPVPATRLRDWWQSDAKTRDHARYCQPLLMANSVGYYILSPARFAVTWNGDYESDVEIEISRAAAHCKLDAHSAHGSFTIQPWFVPMTEGVGDFVWLKAVPNERGRPFTCMEALIEAWWNPAHFGLVFLMNRAGTHVVELGEPIAQMTLFKAAGGFARLEVADALPSEHEAWQRRRTRPSRRGKDFDYLRGRHPDGRAEPTHIKSWSGRGEVVDASDGIPNHE